MFSIIKARLRRVQGYQVFSLFLLIAGGLALMFERGEDSGQVKAAPALRQATAIFGGLELSPPFASPHRCAEIRNESGSTTELIVRVSVEELQLPAGSPVKVWYREGARDAFTDAGASLVDFSAAVSVGRYRAAIPSWFIGLQLIAVGGILLVSNLLESRCRAPVPPAALGWRFVAGMADAAFVAGLSDATLNRLKSYGAADFAVVAVALLSLGAAYHFVCNGMFGRSLGKMLFRIRVTRLGGEPIGWRDATFRALPDFVSYIPAQLLIIAVWVRVPSEFQPRLMADEQGTLFSWLTPGWGCVALGVTVSWQLANILCIPCNDRNRSLHDMIAGTMVTDVPSGGSNPRRFAFW